MTLVAGVDTSTQSCKVVVVDADTGEVVRSGAAKHPDATECWPQAWWDAFVEASAQAGGLSDVEAVSVGGQQHGMVLLDAAGEVIRPAQLWNDTKSAQAASDLVAELGPQAWVDATGLVPVASFTITKLRWVATHEPENAARIAAICLPHDWLTWKIMGATGLETLVTDRSDASGTGYFDSVTNTYRRDLLARALLRDESKVEDIVLPRVLGPSESGGHGDAARGLGGVLVGPGCGDNAGAAMGLGLSPGDVSVSIGTSGVVAAVSVTRPADASGLVAGFADALGGYLPLTATINASRISDAIARMLGVDYDELSSLALAAGPGAGGLTLIPHLDGERTPNLPHASGTLAGMTLANTTRENLARAGVEGLLCLLNVCIEAQRAQGIEISRVTLIGGGAKSEAVRSLAPAVFGLDVDVPPPAEYVALGAARQAAWTLAGGEAPPRWPGADVEHRTGSATPQVYERYALVASRVSEWGD